MTEINPEDVREDPKLTPAEKETHYTSAKDQDHFRVFSEESGVMRRMIKHPDIDVNSGREVDGDVVAVRGTMPVSLLKVVKNPRNDTSHSETISAY
jgi:hypothetical protein